MAKRGYRLSEEDVQGIVAAMSEFAAEIVPGMSLHYIEYDVKGSFSQFDCRHCDVLMKAPNLDICVLRSAWASLYEDSGEPPPEKARRKLIELFRADGWPEAETGSEIKIKLVTLGKEAFKEICKRYSRGGYPRANDYYCYGRCPQTAGRRN